jgi:ribonuclease HII
MICGVDEAGRGPVIGPLVVAGVTFKDDSILIENNVRDSKTISPKRRAELAEIIKDNAINYEIIKISASDIDDLRKIITLNEIEVNVFSKVIDKLKPNICYVDAADVNDIRFGRNIQLRLKNKTNIISKHKADEIYPIVGAASILAKTIRDKEIYEISRLLEKKIDSPMGSGYPSDPVTKNFLNKWYKKYKYFPPYVRLSWKTTQNIISKYKNQNLNLF